MSTSFDAYAVVAHAESNTHVGRSRAYGLVYEMVEIAVGDFVMSVPGGEFWVPVGATLARSVCITMPEKHIFERGPEHPQQWPLANLDALPDRPAILSDLTFEREYPTMTITELQQQAALPVGRTINWLLS